MKDPGKEDIVPFEAGKKRGHVYIPKYNEAELEAMAKKEADAVTLECDEEEALVWIFWKRNYLIPSNFPLMRETEKKEAEQFCKTSIPGQCL